MTEPKKIEYRDLAAGYEFPAVSFSLDSARVRAYLAAGEDASQAFAGTGLVPPLAVAAIALAALAEGMVLPPGTIHVSLELEFSNTAAIGETLTNHARVTRKQERGKFRILAVGINVLNPKQETVVAGETSFILPLTQGAS